MTVAVVTAFLNVHVMVLPHRETHQSKTSLLPVRTFRSPAGYLSLLAVPPSAVPVMDLDFCFPLALLHSQISYHAFLASTPPNQTRRPKWVSPRDILQQRLILVVAGGERSSLVVVKQDESPAPLPLTVRHRPLTREAGAQSAEAVAPVDTADTLHARLASCLEADCWASISSDVVGRMADTHTKDIRNVLAQPSLGGEVA